MHAETVVALASTGVAALIGISVPWMTFRFALRQDQAGWLREQRAALYTDVLAEAQAEQHYLEWALADKETREDSRQFFAATDTRLSPRDRALLGARGTIFASRDVNILFGQMMGVGGRALIQRTSPELQLRARIEVGAIVDKLEATVRRELGADRISLTDGSSSPVQ